MDPQDRYERLYDLRNKEIKEYSMDDNVFIYRCIHGSDPALSSEAENTVAISLQPYVKGLVQERIIKRGAVKIPNSELDDIIQSGLIAGIFTTAKKQSRLLYKYDPSYNTQIHTYLTSWITKAIDIAIDNALQKVELTDEEQRVKSWMKGVVSFIKETGIKDPSPQDYLHRAKLEGKSPKRYNLASFAKILEIIKSEEIGKKKSYEEANENLVTQKVINVEHDAVSDVAYEETLETINKLGYFEKMAIESKITASSLAELDNRNEKLVCQVTCNENGKIAKITMTNNPIKNMHLIFCAKTGQKISVRDFMRLLENAKEELKNRIYNDNQVIHKTYKIENTLELDDSFESFGFTINEDEREQIILEEYNKIYGITTMTSIMPHDLEKP